MLMRHSCLSFPQLPDVSAEPECNDSALLPQMLLSASPVLHMAPRPGGAQSYVVDFRGLDCLYWWRTAL